MRTGCCDGRRFFRCLSSLPTTTGRSESCKKNTRTALTTGTGSLIAKAWTAIKNLWMERSYSNADTAIVTRSYKAYRLTAGHNSNKRPKYRNFTSVSCRQLQITITFTSSQRKRSIFLYFLLFFTTDTESRKQRTAITTKSTSYTIYTTINSCLRHVHIIYLSHAETQGEGIEEKDIQQSSAVKLHYCVSTQIASDTYKNSTYKENKYYWIGILAGKLILVSRYRSIITNTHSSYKYTPYLYKLAI
jgi:hypothetical protein